MTDIQPHQPQQEQPLVTIGDIVFSKSWVVTPNGTRPIAGTQLIVSDYSRTESRMPTWAIVLAVIGAFFFLLGLLFLLVRERTTTGYIHVSLTNGDLVHATQVPAVTAFTSQEVQQRVDYARQLVAAASVA
jgi:hypothetical protein